MNKSNTNNWRGNLDLNPDDANIKPEQIVNLFIEVSQRAEKCFDFQIAAWLEKYEELRKFPNFPEAALLISSASQIYSRKMKYFEDMVLELVGNAKENKEEAKETDQTKIVRRRNKKLRKNTIADSLGEAEFLIKEFDQLPSVKLTEIVKKKNVQFNSHWEKFKLSQCRFLKNKKNKLVVSKKGTTDNLEIIATNATFGKNHIYDYEGEEIVGTKADFRCFSNILNDKCELSVDYNFTKYFQHVDLINQEEEKRQQELPRKNNETRFKFYISNEYLKENYGIEVTQTSDAGSVRRNGEIERDLSQEQNITEFSDLKLNETNINIRTETFELNTSGQSSVSCDSAYQSISSANQTRESSQNTAEQEFFDANDSQVNLNKELTEYNLAQKTLQEGNLLDNNSLDEGISVRSPSILSPINMSETGSEINLDMIFNHESLTYLEHIRKNMEHEDDVFRTFINKENLLWIDRVYLEHREDFELPYEYLVPQIPLKINFLNLPEHKLRRKCLFTLPADEFKSRNTYIKLPAEPPTPRVFKTHLINGAENGELNKMHPFDSDSEEFQGFDEELLLAFNKNMITISTSTPNKRTFVDASNKEHDTNGMITDDEDTPVTKESLSDDNLSTPERIRRAALARISRDSGVISPEPDTLTITISEDKNIPDTIELRRDSDISDSAQSFVSADGYLDSVLSNNDKQLAEQAQQKYQQQVSDMQHLVEKVNRWHQYLKPILKASEERSEFDIHECGSEVLETFPVDLEKSSTTFADVMATKPDDHFARYFLATLMLVNTGNLTMINENRDVNRISEPSEIHLSLKSRVRLHEEIQNMDSTVPCISKNIGTNYGKRKCDSALAGTKKIKKL